MWMQESPPQQLCPIESLLRAGQGWMLGRCSGDTNKSLREGRKVVFGKGALFWEVWRGESQSLSWNQERNHRRGQTVTWGIWSSQVFKLEHLLQQKQTKRAKKATTWQRKSGPSLLIILTSTTWIWGSLWWSVGEGGCLWWRSLCTSSPQPTHCHNHWQYFFVSPKTFGPQQLSIWHRLQSNVLKHGTLNNIQKKQRSKDTTSYIMKKKRKTKTLICQKKWIQLSAAEIAFL